MNLRKMLPMLTSTFLILATLFPMIRLVVSEEVHDLEVSLQSPSLERSHLSSGDSMVLNATVYNSENVNETDVNLQILINGTKVLDSITPTLGSYETFWVAYLWSPTDDGVYNVTAYSPRVNGETIVENNKDTKFVKVCPNQAPIAKFYFTPTLPVKGDIVTFNASASYDPDWGSVTKYQWDFGDYTGTNTSQAIVTHTYSISGYVTITLTVFDDNKPTPSESEPVSNYTRVREAPLCDFYVIQPSERREGPYYINETIIFDASWSYDPDNDTGPPNRGVREYSWDFGDGNQTVTLEPYVEHIYKVELTSVHTVLTVKDYDNLTSSHPYPYLWTAVSKGIATFTVAGMFYVNKSLTFDASASTPDGSRFSYTWDFDDNSTIVTINNPITNHTYEKADIFNVTLTITQGGRHISNTTQQINITIFYDFNGDKKINLLDLVILATRFGAEKGDPDPTKPKYEPKYDVNDPPDGKINLLDLVKVARHFGETDP